MADFKERRFSIDPGKGKKMDGCPYSVYEDGRDVKEYIIPPKGHVFKGFRFDPDASNQIYDGRLIAIYEKEPFNQKVMSNMWKFILAFVIIAVIAIIVILAAGVFKDPTPKPSRPSKEPATVVKTDDTEKEKESIIEQEETATVDANITTEPQPAETIPEVTEQQEEQQEVAPQTASDDPNVQFKQAFWSLIHQRTIMMDPYDALFKEYKNKVEGEEYDYLRFTILKDYPSFKEWYLKLHKVPVSELEGINTISELKNKLNEIP